MHDEPVTGSTPSGSASAEASPAEASFDRCLVDGDPAIRSGGRRRRTKALSLSFMIETGLLALVLLAPLARGVAVPRLEKGAVYFPFVHGAPFHPNRNPNPARPIRPGLIHYDGTFPPARPTGPPPTDDSGEGITLIGGPVIPGPDVPAIFDARPIMPIAPPAAENKKSQEKRTLKLSEGVVAAQLISRLEPRYPPLALQIRLQGTVRLHAIISREGTITSLEVVSGHPLLVGAALDAVKQWRYRPTMLDGEPVEVETTISVEFRLHN